MTPSRPGGGSWQDSPDSRQGAESKEELLGLSPRPPYCLDFRELGGRARIWNYPKAAKKEKGRSGGREVEEKKERERKKQQNAKKALREKQVLKAEEKGRERGREEGEPRSLKSRTSPCAPGQQMLGSIRAAPEFSSTEQLRALPFGFFRFHPLLLPWQKGGI